ncbi:TPA: triose-phosphate isomerase [Klebsiella pneumoniae]
MSIVIGVSHKSYFGWERTLEWNQKVVEIIRKGPTDGSLELFTFPAIPAISASLECFANTPMAIGAQDICAEAPGAWTGEISAAIVQEMGCQYAEIGHAERRRFFNETIDIINKKIDMAFSCHLTPVICIGEPERMALSDAAAYAIAQAKELLDQRSGPIPEVVFAWEPQWAIGAPKPASDEYIKYVCHALRGFLHQHYGTQCKVIYGGSAGPGLLERLWPHVDGLFLGRFAHQPDSFALILEEAQRLLSEST